MLSLHFACRGRRGDRASMCARASNCAILYSLYSFVITYVGKLSNWSSIPGSLIADVAFVGSVALILLNRLFAEASFKSAAFTSEICIFHFHLHFSGHSVGRKNSWVFLSNKQRRKLTGAFKRARHVRFLEKLD